MNCGIYLPVTVRQTNFEIYISVDRETLMSKIDTPSIGV